MILDTSKFTPGKSPADSLADDAFWVIEEMPTLYVSTTETSETLLDHQNNTFSSSESLLDHYIFLCIVEVKDVTFLKNLTSK